VTASDSAHAMRHASGSTAALRPPSPESHSGRTVSTYAALDLGTNNCRLLIARPVRSGFRVVEAFSRIVRLGEGVGHSNHLNEGAIRRTIEALKICHDKMQARGVDRARLIATEACRMAENGQEFLERVRRETGMQLEIVDRRTEAHLAAEGCAALADPDSEGAVLFDIGGGSSEIVWLNGPQSGRSVQSRVRAWTSLPLGVVTLAEKHGGHDVTRDVYRAMVSEVEAALKAFADDLHFVREQGRFHIMGTSGTVTTIAGLHLDLPRYDRRAVDGLWMGDDEVSRVIDRLLDMDYGQRAANPCIGYERADLVLAGCAILDAIRSLFPSTRLRIADRGLREGMLIGMMMEDGVWAESGA
jgi:exopolyphosphatase/guanosine-5'-triphosphate,3'-diphosphate pyrophosphatase